MASKYQKNIFFFSIWEYNELQDKLENLEDEQKEGQKSLENLEDSKIKKAKASAVTAETVEDSDGIEEDGKDKSKLVKDKQAGDDDLSKELIEQTDQQDMDKDPHPDKTMEQVQDNIADTTKQLQDKKDEIKDTSDKLNDLEEQDKKDTPGNSFSNSPNYLENFFPPPKL